MLDRKAQTGAPTQSSQFEIRPGLAELDQFPPVYHSCPTTLKKQPIRLSSRRRTTSKIAVEAACTRYVGAFGNGYTIGAGTAPHVANKRRETIGNDDIVNLPQIDGADNG